MNCPIRAILDQIYHTTNYGQAADSLLSSKYAYVFEEFTNLSMKKSLNHM